MQIKDFSFARMKINAVRYARIFRRKLLFITGSLALITLFSCNSTKKVHTGEYLLTSNKIAYQFGSAQKAKGLTEITDIGKEGIEKFEIPQRIAPSEVLPYVKQKPNTKILIFLPFYLYLYDLPDSAKTARAKAIRDSDYIIKAQKKGWPKEKLKRKMDRRTGREWIMSQGEAPVILDTSLTQKSTEQIKSFLFNKGYFDAEVKDSIHLRGKRAEVTYTIKPGKPYTIRRVQYFSEDPRLAAKLYADSVSSKIRKNDIYDKDNIDAESDRITTSFNNDGYYYFTKQYVSYELDTNSKTHVVDVTVNIKKFAQRSPENKDSIIESNHVWYHLKRIIVQMNYDPTTAIYHATDTLLYDGLVIVSPKGQAYLKPSILKPRIFLVSGDTYRVTNRDDTYTGLSQLDEFTYISIKYTPVKDSNLDCYIQLQPRVKYSVGAEFEFTNTGGDGGIQGDISYGNSNQFNGAEKLQFKINGGLIAQQVFAAGSGNTLLNTANLGPELDLAIPRQLFPFSLFHFARKVNPQTSIKLSFNYQLRLNYYLRHVFGGSYAFDWDPVKSQHITIALLEMNVVNAGLSPNFAEQLDQYNLFFRNSFENQLITDSRISWVYNTQDQNKRQKHFGLFKITGEISGLDFYALEHFGIAHFPIDGASGSYSPLVGLPPYSQYVKGDLEWRHYFILDKNQKEKIVTRVLTGAGLPYDNSSEMPFTKSFWAGGSNDIRAWQIQTLGPGGSSSSSAVVGQIGEIKGEFNLEYRVSLIKYFGMALFIDAGNIWLLPTRANDSIKLSTFHFSGTDNFLNETAVGGGVGFRFDFNYFVFRLDLGQPMRDPSRSPSERLLTLHEYTTRKTVLNIGIGYPF